MGPTRRRCIPKVRGGKKGLEGGKKILNLSDFQKFFGAVEGLPREVDEEKAEERGE